MTDNTPHEPTYASEPFRPGAIQRYMLEEYIKGRDMMLLTFNPNIHSRCNEPCCKVHGWELVVTPQDVQACPALEPYRYVRMHVSQYMHNFTVQMEK